MKSSVSWRSPVAASSSSSSSSSRYTSSNATSRGPGRQQQQEQQRSATMSGYHHHYDYYNTPQQRAAAAASVYHQHQQHDQQQFQQQRHPFDSQPQQYQQQYQQPYQPVAAAVAVSTPPPPMLVLDASNPTPAALIEQASRQACRMPAVTSGMMSNLPRFSLLGGGGRAVVPLQSQQQQSQSQSSSSSRRRGRQEMTNHDTGSINNINSRNGTAPTPRPNQPPARTPASSTNARNTPTAAPSTPTISAAQFARTAPRAGFLCKQGLNIPEWKRRFFVLQPATHLYYFVSPTDTTPRGCLDLTDCWIVDLEQQQPQQQDVEHTILGGGGPVVVDGYLPDPGRGVDGKQPPLSSPLEECPYRFAICWDQNQQQESNHRHNDNVHHVGSNTDHAIKRIILQARNAELAQQWMQAIQCERLDYVKQRWQESCMQVTKLEQTMLDLQHELLELRLVEADRDGALLDAQNSRRDFDDLNEAVRKLAMQLVRPLLPAPPSAPAAAKRDDVSQPQQQQPHSSSDKAHVDGETGTHETTSNKISDNVSSVVDQEKVVIGEDEKKEESEIIILRQQQQGYENNDIHATTKATGDRQQQSLQQQTGGMLNTSLLDEAVLVSCDLDQAEQPALYENDEALGFAPHDVMFDQQRQTGWKDNNDHDFLNVPGVHFSSLYNACQQLRDNWQLAAQEAATAIQDVTLHESNRTKMEARMKRAEKHLCQIWEENCALRKSLKQKKREKRVLVREVRNLQEQQQQQEQRKTSSPAAQEPIAVGPPVAKRNNAPQQLQQPGVSRRSFNKEQGLLDTRRVQQEQEQLQGAEEDESSDEDEERLINELEEHVLSSIRLHEQILGTTGSSTRKRKEDAASASSSGARTMTTAATSCETSQASRPMSHVGEYDNQAMSIPSGSMGSKALFDDSDDDDNDDDDEPQVNGTQEATIQEDNDKVDVSSTCAEASVTEEIRPTGKDVLVRSCDSPDSTPERPNPLLRLDDDSISMDHQSNMCAASSQSESSRSVMITSTGQATSQLACPLADVVDRNGTRSNLVGVSVDLQVYHLTFYSRKIGLQFQKVPPPPIKSKGLLTDALTADLTGDPTAESGNTTAELRRIASISNWARKSEVEHGGSHGRNDNAPVLEVATPIDAVLVCGFHGFDDSGSNIRPKLGARLVAFDGVSVEVGRWTFESIRKSIQARSRPLTLSFRNDFLTTEQRTILTKAVKDVDAAVPPPRPTIQYRVAPHTNSRPPSATPSMQTTTSHESDVFINDIPTTPVVEEDLYDYNHDHNNDAWSVSISGSSCDHRSYGGSRPQSFSAARSVSSAYSSNRQLQHNSFRSFSEAGSSTASVLSAVGPLMAHLLPSVVRKKEQPFTPEYLRSEGSSLEDTPQHQDFKSSLL